MTNFKRLAKLSPVLVLVALALPSSAFGQATRTWVSGVGDDANPCSRTAPCKTFAGAISKTANGGEINCLDPGGFGGVTITKSLTIKCHYTEGGVLVSGTNAIVVNATTTDKVTLRGLDINGIGVGAPTSLVGVKVLNAARVELIDNEIYRFKAGVVVVPAPATANTTKVVLKGNHIHNNDLGVLASVGNANAVTLATLRDNQISDNTCGFSSSSLGTNTSTPTTTDCGAAGIGSGINKTVNSHLDSNGINQNGTAIAGRGSLSTTDVSRNHVSGSSTCALKRLDSAIIRTTSPATNVFVDNFGCDAFNGVAQPLLKRARSSWSKKTGLQ
jgi:hypothetical protein